MHQTKKTIVLEGDEFFANIEQPCQKAKKEHIFN
jgi:hypothetical protein